MSTTTAPRRLTPVRRGDEARVTPLELFFDLVFVLALTQVTALMAAEPTWRGMAKGVLVLTLLWWSWVGYAWLTSVVDPEEGAVRFVIFSAMAAMLVVSLCVPSAFDDDALLFAVAYGFVRFAQNGLFWLGAREDRELRSSIVGLSISTAIAVGIIVGASFLDSDVQGIVWAIALLIDFGGPALFGVEGWTLVPGHFAERHGLIVIIALGESIVALGVGLDGLELGVGEITAAVLGVAVSAALWWLYFDVVAIAAEHRLTRAEKGREQNALARDSYSFLHLPMVLGIVLAALGLKKTLGHVDEPLKLIPAFALVGGIALYLLAHVGFRLRNIRTFNQQRTVVAVALLVLLAAHEQVDALVLLALVTALLWALIAYEAIRFAEARDRLRHTLEH